MGLTVLAMMLGPAARGTQNFLLAYIDPGTGSMILQLLLGGVAGLYVFMKLFKEKLLELLHLKKRDDA
jgi:hypothetical protein